MKFWIAALGCALALGVGIPGYQAKADGAYRPAHAYGPVVFAHKRCIAPARDGAQVTWICNASEKCCYDFVLRTGSCYAPDRRCF